MKKIVNRKLYDTDRLHMVGRWDNGYFYGDFNSISQELYRVNDNDYAIYSFGGPNTRYAKKFSDGHIAGDDLELINKEQALDWAIEHLPVDIVMKEFPGEIE